MTTIQKNSAVAPRTVADPNEADYGTVHSIDGFFARVRWHIAQATYTERLTDLRLVESDEEQRGYREAVAQDVRGSR